MTLYIIATSIGNVKRTLDRSAVIIAKDGCKTSDEDHRVSECKAANPIAKPRQRPSLLLPNLSRISLEAVRRENLILVTSKERSAIL